MASRRGRQQGSGSSGAGGQPDGGLREAQNLVQQYSAGKKFRVKYLGSHDIDDYRNKRETSAIMSDLKRRSSKATKPKAVISLSSKELVVMDEKSKTVTMKVPVQKVKFICHDKHDSSLFGVILATDRITSESQRLHRLFCYQSDAKIAMSFVRSINELFQALGAIMRERRRNAENSSSSTGGGGGAGGGASSSGGGASSSSAGGQANRSQNGQPQATQTSAATRGGDPMSDEEERYEPVPLGFGIAPPPPSYKAAISKKNEAIFRKPDDVVTTVNTRLPPPPSSSRPKNLAAPLPSGGAGGSPVVAPPIAPPPTSRTRRSIGGAGTPTTTAPMTSQTPPTSVATPTSTTTPISVATPTSATSLPLPQVPQEASSNRVDGGAMFNVGGGDEEEENSLTATFEGNIYDVPTSNRAADQGQRAAVWQEWQALESELQNIAQDLGFDMDNGSTVPEGFPGGPLPAVEDMRIPSPIVSTAGEMNQSISSNPEDPFADDFFQSSFGSSSVSISMQAAWPESVSSMNQVEDPFGGTSSGFETIWERSDSVGGGVADPFQEGVVTTPTSSGPTDPFQDSDVTPTSAAASFDFSSQSAWSAAAATTTPVEGVAQSSNGFDEGFGSSWGAFDSEISTATTAPVSQSFPPEQASQPDPIFSPPPSQQATTPKRVDTAQAGPRDIFEPESGLTTASAAAPPTTSLPPPLPKRDSMGLIPPPVSPQRRADAKADRNQSTTPSRSRPRPAAVDSTPNAASQVVLNRPAKSRSSPSQSRASSGEVEAQVTTTQHPPPSEFTADLATFESAFPDLETSDISTSTTAAMASDPFQSDFTSQSTAPPPPSSSQTTASDPFQDVLSLTSANLPTGAIENEASANVSQLSAGNPFLDSFQDSVSSASVQQQAGPTQESPFKVSDGGAVATSNASEANWSAFGASGSKPQETSKSDWSPFGSTGSASQTASGPAQEPTGWSDFGSQPQTQQPPTSSIVSFGDDWSSGGGGASNITSAPQRQSTGTGTVQQTKPSAQAVVPATATSQGKSDSGSWAAFGGGTPTSAPPQQSLAPTASTSAKVGLIAAPPPASKSNRGRDGSVSSRSRPRGRPSTDGALGSQQGLSVALSSQRTPNTGSPGSQPIQNVAKSQPQTTTSNPLNKDEVTTKKSSSYLEDLSSLSAQPQFPTPVAMNYQAGGGPPFPQQQPGGWNGPPPGSQPQQFSQQQQPQPPANFQYGQGVPSQQQLFMQQQQQAMFMQQQQQMQPSPGQVGQMQPGPSHMQRGPGQMQPAPGQMQPGPGQMQPGPGQMQMQPGPSHMQRGPGQMQPAPGQMQMQPAPGQMQMQAGPGQVQQAPWQMQPQAGNYPMQQGAVGQQFSPGGQQVMGPPGAGRQMQPPQFSTPQQQQNFYQQQQQFQQNANAFSPVRPQFQQQQNPLTPGNASMGSVGGGSNLSTSNLYTSDFSSPPYAVGSSTPQSGAGSSPSPPPPTVEYRPAVNDGRPDPFAALVTGALTPSKDKKIDSEKLKAAFVKSPPPNQGYPTTTPGPYGNVPSMNPQGWV